MKTICSSLTREIPGVIELEPLQGANASTQYLGTWGYQSVISGQVERVKVEIGLREPLLLPAENHNTNTLLLDAITEKSLVDVFPIKVMALQEVWSEKVRAALSRQDPAIRDFFDLDYAMRAGQLDMNAPDFIPMVRQKLSVPGNGPVLLNEERRAELERTKETHLSSVLRARDYEGFSLDRIWTALSALVARLNEK